MSPTKQVKVPEGWEDSAREITHGGFWKPEAGEHLRGHLNAIRTDQGEYDGMVADVQTASGEIKSVGMPTVLQSRITRPMIGQEIGILYMGKVKSEKSGRKDFHDFRVFVFGAGPDEDLPF